MRASQHLRPAKFPRLPELPNGTREPLTVSHSAARRSRQPTTDSVDVTPTSRLSVARHGQLRRHDAAACRHAVRQPHVAANHRSLSDGDASEERCAGEDEDIVLDDRVARSPAKRKRVLPGVACAQGYVLAEAYIPSDDGGLADDDSGTVIDREASADFGTRMNLY